MIDMPFTPNCSGLLAFALGGHINSAPKLVPQEAVKSSYEWIGSFTRFPV